MATERPPLELQAELVYPDGTTTRWDKDSAAKDTPTGITLRTKRYTGFADAQFALARPIDIDYPDLGLLDGINLIGHEGSVAYEGRIATMPRNLQTSPSVGIQAQGWMSHAKDQPFVECYVDRDLGKWGSPSRARRAAITALNYIVNGASSLADETGEPVVELAFPGAWVTPYKPLAETLWPPQPGITLGVLYYNLLAVHGVGLAEAPWHLRLGVVANDNSNEGTAVTALGGAYLAATGTAAQLSLWYENTSGGVANETYYAHLAKLAVYGNHGLTRRGEDPGGFYVSDMLTNIVGRYAPKLDPSGIQATTFAVPHASFLAETFAYDALQTLNTYHRWEMDVYEGRRLNYYPIDLTDWAWEVRLSDPGTTVSLQGDDTSNLCNGVIVRYRDLATGYETRLTPETNSELKDSNPDNPANLNGIKAYTTLSLSVPTTKEGALQIGRTYLAEFNQAQAPGTITVTGHIRDRAGHWQQGWKVRSSDTLIVSDLPNESIRVVGETSWDQDSKVLTIAVDSGFKRLDAILARLGVAVEAANLQLP